MTYESCSDEPFSHSTGENINVSEVLQNWREERLIVIFFLALPQAMTLPHGYEIFLLRDEVVPWVEFSQGLNFVGVRFYRRWHTINGVLDLEGEAFELARWRDSNAGVPGTEHSASSQGSKMDPPQTSFYGSILEVATPLLRKDASIAEAVSNAFDRCLDSLQPVMRAYLTASRDVRFKAINRRTCAVVVPMAYQLSTMATTFGQSMFTVHEGFQGLQYEPEELSEDEIRRFEIARSRSRLLDPIVTFVERARYARRAFTVDGDWSSAIIESHIACEVLCNSLLLLISWEEGMKREDARTWFSERSGFLTRVRKELSPRLGGDWNEHNPKSAISLLKEVARYRNLIVHTAYYPSENDAKLVINGLGVIENFMKERLVAKRLRYPRTALQLLGTEGFIKRGFWNGKLKRWFDSHGGIEQSHTIWYNDWLSHRFDSPWCPIPPPSISSSQTLVPITWSKTKETK